MNIRIKETNEIETLGITDPKTGLDWIADLLGNHDALPAHNEDTDDYTMSREVYDWWSDLTARLGDAEEKQADYLAGLSGRAWEDAAEEFRRIECDLEDLPECILEICSRPVAESWEF